MLRSTLTRAAAVAIIVTAAALLSSCTDDKTAFGPETTSVLTPGNQDDEEAYIVWSYVTNEQTGEPVPGTFVEAWWGQRCMGTFYANVYGYYWITLGEEAYNALAYIDMYATHEGYQQHHGGFQYGYGYPTYSYNIELFPGFIDPKRKR
jgi:hypothetical protein